MIVQAHFHLVLTTRCRVKIMNDVLLAHCKIGFNAALKQLGYENKVQMVECNYDRRENKNDHLHILFSVSNFAGLDLHMLVKGIKLCTRTAIRNDDSGQYTGFQWSDTYYIKTIAPICLDEVYAYIEAQHQKPKKYNN